MKKRVIAIIAIILAVIIAALALGLTLSKCTGGKKVVQVVMVDTDKDNDDDTDDDTDDDDDDDDDDFDDDEDDDFDPYKSDNITLDTGFNDYTVYAPEDLTDEVSELYMLNANNDKEHIATTLYRGMTGSVYWGAEFMDFNVFNQAYTEEMLDVEFSRFRDLGLRVLRTGFYSDYMFTGDPENPWDVNTPRMQGFYDFCRFAAKYDLIVAPVLCWSYTNFVMGGSQYLSEVGYMYPRKLDADGNPTLTTKWGNYFYEPDVELMNERYGNWVATAAQAFIDQGLDNVQFFFFGNEPHEDGGTATGAFVDYQIGTFSAGHEALKAAGIRDRFKIIGANQSCVTPRAGLAAAFMSRAPDVFDIYSSHNSPRGASSVEDYYAVAEERFDGWMSRMDDFELRNVKEFWCDEFSGNSRIFVGRGGIDEWIPIQAATRYIAGTNAGFSGMNFWEIFDQLWPGYYGSGGEFLYGVQQDGAARTLYEAEEPDPMLYGLSLFTRYMGSNMKGCGYGTSYRCEAEDDASGLYITMVDRGDGETSIIVCNAATDPRDFQVNLSTSLGGKTLYRYSYSAGSCETATNFTIPTADKGYQNVEKVIVDKLPAGSIAVYSTIKNVAE